MEKKGLPILHCKNPKILLLGSLPGDKSLERKEYYSDNRNRFWKVIASLQGAEQGPSSYEERKNLLNPVHISLWDVYKEAFRKNSLDKDIRDVTINEIVNELQDYPQIDTIAFNGDKAAEAIPSMQEELSKKLPNRKIKYLPLPSSSGANQKKYPTEDLIKLWKDKLSVDANY